jgi:hypothetical protein
MRLCSIVLGLVLGSAAVAAAQEVSANRSRTRTTCSPGSDRSTSTATHSRVTWPGGSLDSSPRRSQGRETVHVLHAKLELDPAVIAYHTAIGAS